MSVERPPAFQFYPRDFASDGDVEAMSTEEVGAYILLLCKAWFEDPTGSLPNDHRTLARWARVPESRWKRIHDKVLKPFTLRDDGRLHQKRMQEVAAEQDEYHQRIQERAKKGAEARWEGHTKAKRKQSPRNAKASTKHMLNDAPSPSPAPSPAVNGEQHSGSDDPEAAPPDQKHHQPPKPAKRELPDMSRAEFCAQAAPLIRQLFWRSEDPPAVFLAGDARWDLGREIDIALKLADVWKLSGDDVLGMIAVARETLEFDGERPLTMRLFQTEARGPANVQDCLQAYRKRIAKRRAAEEGAPRSFTELAASLGVE